MFDKLSKHWAYYTSLILIFTLGFFLMSISSSNRQLQMGIVVFIALSYVLWGILHHLLNHDLSSKIVIEYVLIGSFGLAVVLFLLKGGFGI